MCLFLYSAQIKPSDHFANQPKVFVSLSLSPSASVQSYVDEEEPSRKSILYEDLRVKNRENYEVALTQKAETLLKTTPEKERERPKKEGKLLLRKCVEPLLG